MTAASPWPGDGALNLDWITPHLAVGGAFPEGAVEHLSTVMAIRAVIDLRDEACDNARLLGHHGVAFLHLPTEDHGAVSQAMLDQGVAFAMRHLATGERVLVHCREGIGRSVTLTLCILAALEPEPRGRSPIAAMTLIKERRYYASPSPAQFEAWATWLERQGLPRPDFNAFVAVAYRHLTPA